MTTKQTERPSKLEGIKIKNGDMSMPTPTVEFYVPRLNQKDAAFNPTGGTAKEACANCQWFLGEGYCAVVESYPFQITGNGHSKLWLAKVIPDEMMMGEDEATAYWEARSKAFWEKHKEVALSQEIMAALCEPCAKTMKEFGVTTLKLKEKQMPEAMRAGLCEKMGSAEGFFSKCLDTSFGDFQPEDKEAFCASLHKECVGKWPSQKSRFDQAAEKTASKTEDGNKDQKAAPAPSGSTSNNMLDTLAKSVRGLFSGMKKPAADGEIAGQFQIFRDKAGSLRWLALVSNNYRDMDNPPEIIEAKAHEKYVSYVDKSKNFPELWIWHVPGTGFGKSDWLDYDKESGLLWASGTIEKGKEAIAERLSKKNMLGVSHGFYFSYSDEKERVIGDYRTYEISVLPVIAAANPWTSFEVILEDAKMLDAKKRSFLVEVMGEDAVKGIEARGEALAKELKAMGIQSKEAKPGDPPEEDAFILGMKELTKSINDTNATIKGFESRLGAMEKDIKALQKSDDEKIAEALSAAKAQGAGFRASTSKENKIEKEEAIKESPNNGNRADGSWFGNMDKVKAGASLNVPH